MIQVSKGLALRALLMRALPALVCWFAADPVRARADVVGAVGDAVAVGVTITRVEDGHVSWKGRDGAEVTRPIEQIEYLQVTGWPMLNLAEKQIREHHVHQACVSLEKALADVIGAPGTTVAATDSGPNRVILARCRLVRAYELDLRFDRAVSAYLELLIGPGGLAWQGVRPRPLLGAASPELSAAARLVDATIRQHASDDVGEALRDWRRAWPTSRPSSEQGISIPDASVDERASQALAKIRELVQSNHFDEAVAAARELEKDAAGSPRAEAYFWEAQALLGRANAQPAAAEADRRRAGLALMRVVIHFPNSSRTPDALYQAGQLCRDAGQSQQAQALWSELIAKYPADLAAVGSARQELAGLPHTQPSDK
jgi:tetratricopeptide (TPR) repeat protein